MQVDGLDNKHVGYKAIEDPASAQGPPGEFLYFVPRRDTPCGSPYKSIWGSQGKWTLLKKSVNRLPNLIFTRLQFKPQLLDKIG